MIQYTLKKTENGLLLLSNEGKEVSLLELLQVMPGARVYAFEGGMGAGKTTLIKQLCEAMGVTDTVNSPTFAIVNVYDSAMGEINHFDCYRLKSLREAYDLGTEEYLESGNYCFVEWPDIIEDLLPANTVTIKIYEVESGGRKIEVC